MDQFTQTLKGDIAVTSSRLQSRGAAKLGLDLACRAPQDGASLSTRERPAAPLSSGGSLPSPPVRRVVSGPIAFRLGHVTSPPSGMGASVMPHSSFQGGQEMLRGGARGREPEDPRPPGSGCLVDCLATY